MDKVKNKGGRPRKVLTPEQVAEVETLAALLTQEQIADYFGISKPTFKEIMKEDSEVSFLYKRGRTKAVGSVAKSLLMQAREGNITAAIFYLKTQAGWREKTDLDITSSDGSLSPSVIELVAPKIPEVK